MAYIECNGGGKKATDIISIIDSIPAGDFSTTGISIYSSRIEIVSGGYCIKDGMVYGKMKLKSKYNFASNDDLALYNLPDIADHSKLYWATCYDNDVDNDFKYSFVIRYYTASRGVETNMLANQMPHSRFLNNTVATFYFAYPSA